MPQANVYALDMIAVTLHNQNDIAVEHPTSIRLQYRFPVISAEISWSSRSLLLGKYIHRRTLVVPCGK